MPKFYVTYGNNLIRHYSVVEADDEDEAREIAYEGTDSGKFAFMYTEEQFAGQAEKYHLTEIELQPMEV